VSAADVPVNISPLNNVTEIRDAIQAAIEGQGGNNRVTVTGSFPLTDQQTVAFQVNAQSEIIWEADISDGRIEITFNNPNATFTMNSGRIGTLSTNGYNGPAVNIGGSASIGELYANVSDPGFEGPTVYLRGNPTIGEFIDVMYVEMGVEQRIFDLRGESNDPPPPAEDDNEPESDRRMGDEIRLFDQPNDIDDKLTVVITDNKKFIKDGIKYAGIVDIKSFFTDIPKAIPKEVIIGGLRYLVGDTIYIVGEENLEIIGYTETGVSYVFPAVENSDRAATFSAIGLPKGVKLSADGKLSTETLPLRAGIYRFKVTVNNGLDTHTISVKLNIKGGYASDDELIDNLTHNDKEDQPEVLDDEEDLIEDGSDVPRFWLNGELKLHYSPEMVDFDSLFLNGKLLKRNEDYRVDSGSTVIILTEQTIAPLPNGDHVVTTMFHQNSDVGLDTVINDVGGSSFVFRFGDDTEGKRINITGDGVEGSVTFDDKNSKETPITAISANTEEIETRAKNLSNATGCEIVAAFETKQHGGFGGKTATFAVSASSLDLKLKNKTTVYIAVYDSKTGKTYQNKGEVKDGMIVFKTKHSGVFMLSLKKY
jgi:hypothetical protein